MDAGNSLVPSLDLNPLQTVQGMNDSPTETTRTRESNTMSGVLHRQMMDRDLFGCGNAFLIWRMIPVFNDITIWVSVPYTIIVKICC